MRAAKPDLSNINLDRLPPQLRTLVRVLGEAMAYRLVEQRGGSYVIVPKTFKVDHDLHEVLGTKGFGALVDAYGGSTLQLPKSDSLLRQVRHQRVVELLGQGYLVREVALKVNYTVRQVFNIKQSIAPADTQIDLWGLMGDEGDGKTVDIPAPQESGPTAHNPFGL